MNIIWSKGEGTGGTDKNVCPTSHVVREDRQECLSYYRRGWIVVENTDLLFDVFFFQLLEIFFDQGFVVLGVFAFKNP